MVASLIWFLEINAIDNRLDPGMYCSRKLHIYSVRQCAKIQSLREDMIEFVTQSYQAILIWLS